MAIFVDLRSAFDTISRKVVLNAMRSRGMREKLMEKVGEILRKTRSKVRIGEREVECFETARGVRQGCPPLLFNLVLADLEKEIGRVRWGRMLERLEERKVFSLAYADDIVLSMVEEEEIKSIIERLEEYIERKGLEVNVEKIKMMKFKKGEGRWRKVNWSWRGQIIEDVKNSSTLHITGKWWIRCAH